MVFSLFAEMRTGARPPRWRWGVLIGYWVVLFVATHLPSAAGTPPLPLLTWVALFDKATHFAAYALLAWLLAWCTGQTGRRSTLRVRALLWLVVAAYGTADELLQWPVGRSCELEDWLADVAGAAAGLAFAALLPAAGPSAPGDDQ